MHSYITHHISPTITLYKKNMFHVEHIAYINTQGDIHMMDIDMDDTVIEDQQCIGFESKIIALHKNLKDRHVHPLQAWAEMSHLIEFRKVEDE